MRGGDLYRLVIYHDAFHSETVSKQTKYAVWKEDEIPQLVMDAVDGVKTKEKVCFRNCFSESSRPSIMTTVSSLAPKTDAVDPYKTLPAAKVSIDHHHWSNSLFDSASDQSHPSHVRRTLHAFIRSSSTLEETC
jgi:hypothetical protein